MPAGRDWQQSLQPQRFRPSWPIRLKTRYLRRFGRQPSGCRDEIHCCRLYRSAAMLSEAIHSTVDNGNQLLLLLGQPCRTPGECQAPLRLWAPALLLDIRRRRPHFRCRSGRLGLRRYQQDPRTPPSKGRGLITRCCAWGCGSRAQSGSSHSAPFGNQRRRPAGWKRYVSARILRFFTVLFEDTAAMLGLLVALLGIALSQILDMPILDGVASLLIGLLLAGRRRFWHGNASRCSPAKARRRKCRQAFTRLLPRNSRRPSERNSDDALWSKEVLVVLSLDLVDSGTAADVERAVTRIERRTKAAHPEVKRCLSSCKTATPIGTARLPRSDVYRCSTAELCSSALITAPFVGDAPVWTGPRCSLEPAVIGARLWAGIHHR